MTIKESDDSAIDYEFIRKYIRDDSDKNKEANQTDFSLNFVSQKQSGTSTEILSREGEGESYRENSDFNKKPWQKNKGFEEPLETDESNETIESQSKPLTEAKKEFLEHLEDDSLTVDTCTKLTHDWNNK